MLLEKGVGHAKKNREKAMQFLVERVPEVRAIDEATIDWPPYGVCHFSSFTASSAMISSTKSPDNTFGGVPWHAKGRAVIFHDLGDGRICIYICSIKALLDNRTAGQHGVKWPDVRKLAEHIRVFKIEG